ncbi:MAG: substrate-binding domain-containing protein [Spirochaetia bacterium]|jgi:ribose transport system substrate-binding protein
MARKSNWLRGGLVILFCLAVTLGAFASGGGEASGGKGFVVGLSNGPFTHSWRVQMIESLHQQSEAYIARGWMSKLIVQNAGEDVNTQIAQIRNLIASKVNLILINPNSATALVPVIKEAQDAGILCIIYDQGVTNPPCLNVHMHQAWWMGPIVDWLAKQLDGKGNIVYISGIADQPGNIERDQAAMDELKKFPGLKLLATANGNWDQAAAQQKMTDLLGSFPNIDGVLTQDGMSLGILRAFDASGRKIPFVTGETQVAFIKEWKKRKDASGFSTFGVENSPGAVCTSLGIGLRLLQGKKLKASSFVAPNEIWTKPFLFVDNGNIDATYAKYKDTLDSFYVNTWYSEDAIDALFQ